MRSKKFKIIAIIFYLAVLLYSWFSFYYLVPGDELGVGFLFFYLLLPVSTLLVSLFIGSSEKIGKLRWITPIFFGIMYMSPLFMSGLKEGESFLEVFKNYYDMSFNGLAISLVGIILGYKDDRKTKEK